MEEEWRSSKCEGCSYSVCVCMGQRLTDRHAQRERERERQTETERQREREREHLEVFLSLTSGENLARGTYSGNSSATRATIDKRACQ